MWDELDNLRESMIQEAEEVYWRPEEPGDYVWGILEDVFEEEITLTSGEEIKVRVAKLKDPKTGQIRLVRLIHKTLKDLWERYQPEIGDLILIKLVRNVYDHSGEKLKYRVFGMSIRRKADIEHIIPVSKIISEENEEEIVEKEEKKKTADTVKKSAEKIRDEQNEEEVFDEDIDADKLAEMVDRLAQYTLTMLNDFYEEVTENDIKEFAQTLNMPATPKLIKKTIEALKASGKVKVEDGIVRLSTS